MPAYLASLVTPSLYFSGKRTAKARIKDSRPVLSQPQEPANHGSAFPETIYLAVILDEYYAVVLVSVDRKIVPISNWNDPVSFPEELLEVQTALALQHIPIEFYQAVAE